MSLYKVLTPGPGTYLALDKYYYYEMLDTDYAKQLMEFSMI